MNIIIFHDLVYEELAGFDDVRGFYSDDVKVRSIRLVILHLGPDYGELRSTSSIVNVVPRSQTHATRDYRERREDPVFRLF